MFRVEELENVVVFNCKNVVLFFLLEKKFSMFLWDKVAFNLLTVVALHPHSGLVTRKMSFVNFALLIFFCVSHYLFPQILPLHMQEDAGNK